MEENPKADGEVAENVEDDNGGEDDGEGKTHKHEPFLYNTGYTYAPV